MATGELEKQRSTETIMNRSNFRPTHNSNAAFALNDLLITLAVLALLIIVQLPSMAGGSRNSNAETCRNNLRQLIQAWQMYAADNSGKITPNNGSDPGPIGSWVKGWLDFTSSQDNINVDYLVGFDGPRSNRMYGHLGRYLQSPNVFRCPSDTSTAHVSGGDQARVRSVSMNSWMGGNEYCGSGQYRIYKTLGDVATPARRFVIIEERPDSINDGMLMVDMISAFVDFPAFYHNSGSWISFADGHVELRRWTDPRTMPGFKASEFIPLIVPSPNNSDLDWIRERTTELR